ncbi:MULTISPECIES: hypothetical protein [unclassified Curtobacterium]|uniref:hypothetical protein n=1 Tax=unclassified Curtobacterium TaxID=257496 RepID=UPI00204042BD|nr:MULTISPECIES: hypothetical protein [unclassified Curtobacterium]MCM3522199.1 hypothetical protein [Curtobacterium sp. P97]MDB6428019.1 hypothetical protein [Curtobacterium sp. 20TX0008]
MTARQSLSELRSQPAEWHRQGMWHPTEIEMMVHHRLLENVPAEPSYGDFFRTT